MSCSSPVRARDIYRSNDMNYLTQSLPTDETNKSPRRGSPRARGCEVSVQQATCEKILCDQLVNMKKMLLKQRSISMMHDQALVDKHLDTRAQEAIEEELGIIIKRLVRISGPSHSHRMTAYVTLFGELNAQVHKLIFTGEREKLQSVQSDMRLQKVSAKKESLSQSNIIAAKIKKIDQLQIELKNLDIKYKNVVDKANHFERELEKNKKDQAQTHQNIVELRMQGIDFKSEVNRRSLKILRSIQSRMGFVPTGVQKQILLLNILKAPGDPLYDEVRRSKKLDGDSDAVDVEYRGFRLGGRPGPNSLPLYPPVGVVGRKLQIQREDQWNRNASPTTTNDSASRKSSFQSNSTRRSSLVSNAEEFPESFGTDNDDADENWYESEADSVNRCQNGQPVFQSLEEYEDIERGDGNGLEEDDEEEMNPREYEHLFDKMLLRYAQDQQEEHYASLKKKRTEAESSAQSKLESEGVSFDAAAKENAEEDTLQHEQWGAHGHDGVDISAGYENVDMDTDSLDMVGGESVLEPEAGEDSGPGIAIERGTSNILDIARSKCVPVPHPIITENLIDLAKKQLNKKKNKVRVRTVSKSTPDATRGQTESQPIMNVTVTTPSPLKKKVNKKQKQNQVTSGYASATSSSIAHAKTLDKM